MEEAPATKELVKDDRKTILMLACRKIIEMNRSTVSLMRHNPINSLRVVKRNSKSAKDANPISSTMILMSHKYPISVNKELLKDYDVPPDLISTKSDTHRAGHILAKKDILDWWVTSAPLPDAETEKAMELIHRRCKAEVDLYNSINWKDITINYGVVSMDRKRIATQKPPVNIAANLRETAVLQVLAPEYVTPYDELPSVVVSQLKEIASMTLSSRMAFATQARVLLNDLDPKVRYLPAQQDAADISGQLRYCLCQANFSVTNIQIPKISENKETEMIMNGFCEAVHFALNKKPSELYNVKEALQGCTIYGNPIRELFDMGTGLSGDSVNLVKTMLSMPITLETKMYNMQFCPHPVTRVSPMHYTTQSNVRYTVYRGREKVSFRYGGMVGEFVKSTDTLLSMTSTATNLQELREAAAAIGVYTRIGFQLTRYKDWQETVYRMYKNFKAHPSRVLSCSVEQITMAINDTAPPYPKRAGLWSIVQEMSYLPTAPAVMKVTEDIKLMNPSNGVQLDIKLKSSVEGPNVIISGSVEVPRASMLSLYLDPRRRILYLMETYLTNFKYLLSRISKGDWQWRNETISFLTHDRNKLKFSRSCRTYVRQLYDEGERDKRHENVIMCMAYCFCHPPLSFDEMPETIETKLKWVNDITIDLRATAPESSFRYDEDRQVYTLFGKRLGVLGAERSDTGKLFRSILPGFRISDDVSCKAQVSTLRLLSEQREVIEEGQKFQVHINSRPYVAIRDSYFQVSAERTMRKRLADQIVDRAEEESRANALRARLE